MDRSLFERRFLLGAAQARDFARQFISEPLPDAMLFHVHLNSSYDAHATSEFKLFAQDSSAETALCTKGLSADDVVKLLWRDGFVPQWVDLQVVGETGLATIVSVSACGRFIDDESRLYYTWTDCAPFGVKGPTFPVDHVEGKAFSIYARSSCWSLDDLARASLHSQKVWSLELNCPSLDDGPLARLEFPNLEILELFGVTLDGGRLSGLAGLPKIRHLRMNLPAQPVLDLSRLPTLEHLESLSIRFAPPKLQGLARLGEAMPALSRLTLASACQSLSDNALELATLRELTVEFPRIPDWIHASGNLNGLSIHAPEATHDEIARLLASCGPVLSTLSLRDTPATDLVFGELMRFTQLQYLDVVNTSVTPEALDRFVAERPSLRCHPRPVPDR